jgi:hypothetical protein
VEARRDGTPAGPQIYVPRGRTFADAEALIYVEVTYNDDQRSLEAFIETSQARWRAAVGAASIDPLPSEPRRNAAPAYQLFRYHTPGRPQQAHEIVAFGRDADRAGDAFFVMVVLTAATRAAIDANEPAYRQALRAH